MGEFMQLYVIGVLSRCCAVIETCLSVVAEFGSAPAVRCVKVNSKIKNVRARS